MNRWYVIDISYSVLRGLLLIISIGWDIFTMEISEDYLGG